MIINSYGSSKNESADKHVIVKLNEFKTYSELIERLEKIACQDSVPKIIFHNKNSIENIFPVFDCHPAPFNPRGKYALRIIGKEAYVDDTEIEVTRKLLPQLFKEHFSYFNKGNSNGKPDFYIVIIQALESEDTKAIRPLLQEILNHYNSLDSKAVLNIAFWYEYAYMPPPQPELLNQNSSD